MKRTWPSATSYKDGEMRAGIIEYPLSAGTDEEIILS